MLQVKNLTKVYRPKHGVPVRALDRVSLEFEETGMVFVLGKSGSGKSTFLNLIGGLDTISEGEVIIKGKSSNAFSQGDFDAYRNTFLGFIFQEYNILKEFNVGSNIALALQLQGKKATREVVERILQQVDLAGYYDRKIMELSGGQKQRVAIARALIKDPQIILADEPTGALDSNTGRQVFETLQKLSKEKLVIIVSHDRDYAELYGDRVIEFADGRIVSDIKKVKTDGVVVSDAVKAIDGSIMRIKRGHKLTRLEKEKILAFLESAEMDDSADVPFEEEHPSAEPNAWGAQVQNVGNAQIQRDAWGFQIQDTDNTQIQRDPWGNPIGGAAGVFEKAPPPRPERAPGDIIISFDRKANRDFRRLARIDAEGNKDAFQPYVADPQKRKQYEPKDCKLIRSRFPFGRALKMAGSSLKVKPIRLFFTILFCFFSFTMFGMSDTLACYKDVDVTYNSMREAGIDYVRLEKQVERREGNRWFHGSNNDPFTEEDFQKISGKFPGIKFDKVFNEKAFDGRDLFYSLSLPGFRTIQGNPNELYEPGREKDKELPRLPYYYTVDQKESLRFSGVVEVSESETGNTWNGFAVIGSLPKNDDEMMIPKYVYEVFEELGYFDVARWMSVAEDGGKGDPEKLKDFVKPVKRQEELIGEWIQVLGQRDMYDRIAPVYRKVVGIVDTKLSGEYEKYKTVGKENEKAEQGHAATFASIVSQSYHKMAYMTKGSIEKIGEALRADEKYLVPRHYGISLNLDPKVSRNPNGHELSYLANHRDFGKNGLKAYFDEAGKTKPEKNEILLGLELLRSIVHSDDAGREWYNQQRSIWYGESGADGEKAEAKALIDYIFNGEKVITVGIQSEKSKGVFSEEQWKIVGYCTNEYSGEDFDKEPNSFNYIPSGYTASAVVSDEFYDSVIQGKESAVGALLAPFPSEKGTAKSIIGFSYSSEISKGTVKEPNPQAGTEEEINVEFFTRYNMVNPSVQILDRYVNSIIKELKKPFLYVALALAFFASLLFLNFIIVSIANKKHEIGILRAIGAKGLDVFLIFFLESVIIALICCLLSSVGVGVGAFLLNASLKKAIQMPLTLFTFGIRQIALILGISLGVAFVSTVLPVFQFSRKKPIETIRKS